MESESNVRRFCLSLTALLLGVAVLIPLASTSAEAVAAPAPRAHPNLPSPLHITDFPTAHNTFPAALTSGPEGKLWFTEDVSEALIGSFDPSSHTYNYYTLNQGIFAFKAQGITVDHLGNLWMSANGTYAYKFDPTNKASENFERDVSGSEQSVTAAPDGNIWFSGDDIFSSGCYLYEANPVTDVFTKHTLQGGDCTILGITIGQDGNLWFLDETNNAVGEYDPSSGITHEYPLPSPNALALAITPGPNDTLWFTEPGVDKIGTINIDTHVITEFDVPTPNASPRCITMGPDGEIWFTERDNAAIGRVDVSNGDISQFSVAGVDPNGTGAFLDGITTGADGNLWITDEDDQLLRVSLAPTIVTEPSNQTASLGEMVHFTSTASGIPAPSVQWQESFDGGTTWAPVEGGTSTNLSLNASPGAAAAEYRALFTSSTGSVVSTTASLRLLPSPAGYWLAGRDGGVFAFGGAHFFGSLPSVNIRPSEPIVAMASTPDGNGYWLVGSDGGVFAFGGAHFFGSLPSDHIRPAEPIVAMASTPDGNGYWLVGSDGGVFGFGDARFFGSLPSRGIKPADPVTRMVATPTGLGYWLVGSDGGIFALGDARFFGSLPSRGISPGSAVVGSDVSPNGLGYWLVGSNGDVFAFGSAGYHGNSPSKASVPIIGIANDPHGQGYWLVGSDGSVSGLGPIPTFGSLPELGKTVAPADAIASVAAQP
jgi:streptogramin lyase